MAVKIPAAVHRVLRRILRLLPQRMRPLAAHRQLLPVARVPVRANSFSNASYRLGPCESQNPRPQEPRTLHQAANAAYCCGASLIELRDTGHLLIRRPNHALRRGIFKNLEQLVTTRIQNPSSGPRKLPISSKSHSLSSLTR